MMMMSQQKNSRGMAFSRNEKIAPIRSSFELKNGARTIGRINI